MPCSKFPFCQYEGFWGTDLHPYVGDSLSRVVADTDIASKSLQAAWQLLREQLDF